MRIRNLFSDDDLEAIRKATSRGESRTAGEIVPYIVERVIDGDEAKWRGATLGALGAALQLWPVDVVGCRPNAPGRRLRSGPLNRWNWNLSKGIASFNPGSILHSCNTLSDSLLRNSL